MVVDLLKGEEFKYSRTWGFISCRRKDLNSQLSSKNLNLIVANDVSDSSIGFDSNNNEVTLITEKEELNIPKTSKEKVARKIVQFISKNVLDD